MALATERIRLEKDKQEIASNSRLSDTVDLLAKKYDRYNLITETKVLNTRCHADGLPCIVPRELMGIWLLASDFEPTQEETTYLFSQLAPAIR